MTALLCPPVPARVRPVPESRPPCVSWPAVIRVGMAEPGPLQPTIDFTEAESAPADGTTGAPRPGGRLTLVRAPWTVRPDPDLPDAAGWSGLLAVAVVEALLARRPVAQLNRWLSEEVLASVTLHQRRRVARPGASARPQLVSARVQHPSPRVAEAAAFLRVGRRPLALAMRLEGLGDRWACTALELGPRP